MKSRSTRGSGFTLVEMLVSLAVLSLLVLLLVQVTNMTGQAIRMNSQRLDAAGQARLVFDRLASDLAARIKRTDLPMTFTSASGNDSFQFYSEVEGYTGDRQLSIIGYRIDPNAHNLQRGATGTDFNGAQQMAFSPSPMTLSAPADADFEVLAPGVFRLEFCYLLKTGVLSASNGGANANDYSNVAGIVVALGVIDAQNLKLLTSASQLDTLAQQFPDAGNQDPLSVWNPILAGLNISGIPIPVSRGVRLYERTFLLQ